MISWKFEISKQPEYYETFKKQFERKVWHDLNYYVLPYMPLKFRDRIIFLPEKCSPDVIYKKQKFRLNKLEFEWNKQQKSFTKSLTNFFPNLNEIKIVISPSFYGSIGWYGFWDNGKTILIRPRYDRHLIDIQKLVVNSLTHYFYVTKEINLNKGLWLKKQSLAEQYQNLIFGINNKSKTMHKILDTNFSGELAEKSICYLRKLNLFKESDIEINKKLTKTENNVFELLMTNRYKLVSNDEIATRIWGDDYFDKYSEYAITKHIEELKKKITKNSIHSQRGFGYILV